MDEEPIRQELTAQAIVNDTGNLQDHNITASLAMSSFAYANHQPIRALSARDLSDFSIANSEFPFNYNAYSYAIQPLPSMEKELKSQIEELKVEIAKIKQSLINTTDEQRAEHRKMPV